MFYFADSEDVSLHQLKILDNNPFVVRHRWPSWIQLFSLTVKRSTSVAPPPVTMPEVNWSRGGGLKMGADARDTTSVMVMDIFIGDIVTAPLADHTHAVEVWTPPPSQIINRPSVQLDCNYLFDVGQWSEPDTSSGWIYLVDIHIHTVTLSNVLQGPHKLPTKSMWLWGPLKCTISNCNPVHVFLHFGTFGSLVLQLILASKLSELEQFEFFSANNQLESKQE